MPYFLNIINAIAIFIMLSVYFACNLAGQDRKKNNSKILYYENTIYIYVAILAGLINIMNSINLSDAVFWYGVSLSFGIKGAIFILVIAGILIMISWQSGTSVKKDKEDLTELMKTIQENIRNISSRNADLEEIIKDFKKRFAQIATPEEVDEKIREMVENRIDTFNNNIQELSDKTAIIAEELTKIKGGSLLPSTKLEEDQDNIGKRLLATTFDDEDDE